MSDAKPESRIGFDADEGIWFDRTKPVDVDFADGLEQQYEQCDPEDVVDELTTALAAAEQRIAELEARCREDENAALDRAESEILAENERLQQRIAEMDAEMDALGNDLVRAEQRGAELETRDSAREAALQTALKRIDLAEYALANAAALFAKGDDEGVRRILCDTNARSHVEEMKERGRLDTDGEVAEKEDAPTGCSEAVHSAPSVGGSNPPIPIHSDLLRRAEEQATFARAMGNFGAEKIIRELVAAMGGE